MAYCHLVGCIGQTYLNPQAGKAPDWWPAMQPGRWYRISGDRPDLGLPPTPVGTRYLADGNPANDVSLNPARSARERLRRLAGREWLAPWSGRMGFCALTEAWNSAVFASRLGTSGAMVLFGGGHNDYFGSDVHAFDLGCREWRRLTTGYVSGTEADYGAGAIYPESVYPDESPLPPHTYDYVQYDARGNDFILLKGQTELGPSVKAVAIPHLLNLDSLSWRHGPQHESAILNAGGYSTWDEKRRILWGHSGDDGGGNAFVAFSPDGTNEDGSSGRWVALHDSKLAGEANHNAMQVEPLRDRIVFTLHARDALAILDPDDPAAPLEPFVSRGDKPRIREFSALEWSDRLGSLVYYSAADGAAVYAIECDKAARWRPVYSAGCMDPVTDAAGQSRYYVNQAHTFGRFRIARFEECDLAILVRHVDTPVYAMRVAG